MQRSHLTLIFENILKLLASVLKICGKNGETGFARRYEVRPFLAPLPGVIEPRIEFMPFALPKYYLRIYSKSKMHKESCLCNANAEMYAFEKKFRNLGFSK